MTRPELNGLSEQELDLLAHFLSDSHNNTTKTVADILTTQEFGSNDSFGAGLGDVLYFISPDVSRIDREILRLDNMMETLERVLRSTSFDDSTQDNTEITVEKLHWLSIRSKLISFYSQAGILLETFSSELILESVVDNDRRSNRVERDIKNKSQWEREWLLFVTGVIDSGEKDNIRTVYRKRNNLVHESTNYDGFSGDSGLESDLSHAWETVDILHEKLYGIKMNQRISDLFIGENI